MGFLVGALCIILLVVFVVQIAKAREIASVVRANPSEEYDINKFQAAMGVIFMIAFLLISVGSFVYYTPILLGWGPNIAASEHGPTIDYLFNITLLITGVVFILTHIALFWFAWKYRGRPGRKAIYWAHNDTLEMVWMVIPSIVMAFLVIGGLDAWNDIMTDLPKDAQSVVLPSDDADNEFIEIEATGSQFLWFLRYPGRDGKLGTKYFTQISSSNPVGQTWTDAKNIDDFMSNEVVLPVGKKVRVRITARDVLHNFYIKDMRVKMDAVPGMPTYFIFTPTVTTAEMRKRLSEFPEWQVPDKNDPTKKRWETFQYELACAELCGRGHYSMRALVKILEVDEYLDWLDEKEGGKLVETIDTTTNTVSYALEKGSINSQYFSKVNGTQGDPQKDNQRIKDLETLVTNRLLITKIWEGLSAKRSAAGANTPAFKSADNAMIDVEEQLEIARITNDKVVSNAALTQAKKAAQI